MHHTLGLLVALGALVRVNWRIQVARPAYPAHMGRARRRLAQATHLSLVALMFLFPLSGWAAVATATTDLPITFFVWEIPRMYEEPPGTSLVHDVSA